MSTLHRQRVVRADGRAINVVQRRAHLSYCFTGCCSVLHVIQEVS
jgi:cobaltochelatase CobN